MQLQLSWHLTAWAHILPGETLKAILENFSSLSLVETVLQLQKELETGQNQNETTAKGPSMSTELAPAIGFSVRGEDGDGDIKFFLLGIKVILDE